MLNPTCQSFNFFMSVDSCWCENHLIGTLPPTTGPVSRLRRGEMWRQHLNEPLSDNDGLYCDRPTVSHLLSLFFRAWSHVIFSYLQPEKRCNHCGLSLDLKGLYDQYLHDNMSNGNAIRKRACFSSIRPAIELLWFTLTSRFQLQQVVFRVKGL